MLRLAIGILLLCVIQVGCKPEEEVGLVNSWELEAILADPGDGSGQFETVNSDKLIEFFEDGTYTCNGSLCTMGGETVVATTGTYSVLDSTIVASGCGVDFPFPLTYDMSSDTLIINYQCFEACRERYLRVN